MANYVAKKADQNGIIHFDEVENDTWSRLLDRQMKVVQERSCDEFILGLEKLNFPKNRIPQCHEVSEVLCKATGWTVVPVEAIIPLSEFFRLLSNRQFPAASFIRRPEDLDYLQEPDIFHEYFGHCPLLTNRAYADFVHWYGQSVLGMPKQLQSVLGRLFWFTIEFGLVSSEQGLRIYGGGILSSFAETIYALEDQNVARLDFNLLDVLNTSYRYDQIQKQYFVIRNLDQLFSLKSQSILELAKRIALGDKPDNDFIIC